MGIHFSTGRFNFRYPILAICGRRMTLGTCEPQLTIRTWGDSPNSHEGGHNEYWRWLTYTCSIESLILGSANLDFVPDRSTL